MVADAVMSMGIKRCEGCSGEVEEESACSKAMDNCNATFRVGLYIENVQDEHFPELATRRTVLNMEFDWERVHFRAVLVYGHRWLTRVEAGLDGS